MKVVFNLHSSVEEINQSSIKDIKNYMDIYIGVTKKDSEGQWINEQIVEIRDLLKKSIEVRILY